MRTKEIITLLVLCVACGMAAVADFDVRSYGAKGDGVTFDTEAVQKAMDACAVDGGGRVVLDVGTFLIKPIFAGRDVAGPLLDGRS